MRRNMPGSRAAAALLLVLLACLSACGRQKEPGSPGGQEQEESAQEETGPGNDQEEGQDQETGQVSGEGESGAQTPGQEETVTLVIPAAYLSVSSQEEADRIRENNGYESVVLSEDGSLSVTMRRSVYNEMMKSFSETVDQGLRELAASEFFPEIRSVEHNDDYSVFTVVTASEKPGAAVESAAQELFMYGTLYHFYSGNDVREIRVVFVSASSGEVLKELYSGGLDK